MLKTQEHAWYLPLVPSWNPFLQVRRKLCNCLYRYLLNKIIFQRFQFNWLGKVATCVLLYVLEVNFDFFYLSESNNKCMFTAIGLKPLVLPDAQGSASRDIQSAEHAAGAI